MSAALQLYRHDWQWRGAATRYQARQMSRKRRTSVDEKQLQAAYAVPAGWEMKDDGKRVFPGCRLTCIGG
jgi:hypothetical protein